MRGTLYKYITKNLLLIFAVITLVLTALACLGYSIRILHLMVDTGGHFADFLSILLLLSPSLLLYIMPIALCLSIIDLVAKMKSDRELTILRVVGLANWQIAMPILAVALLITAINYLNSTYLMPITYSKFKDTHHLMASKSASLLLQEGTFNFTDKGKLAFYVQSKNEDGSLAGILISDSRQPAQQRIISAPYGRIVMDRKLVLFELDDGLLQEKNPSTGKISMLRFAKYRFNLLDNSKAVSDRYPSHFEMTLWRMMQELKKDDNAHKSSIYAALHQRIAWPLLNLTIAALSCAILLSQPYRRSQRIKDYVISFVSCLVLFLLCLWLNNLLYNNLWWSVPLYMAIFMPLMGSWVILKDSLPLDIWRHR